MRSLLNLRFVNIEIPGHCNLCNSPINRGDPAAQMSCNHTFHLACVIRWSRISTRCPTCSIFYGIMLGDQPPGIARVYFCSNTHCGGYSNVGAIMILYIIPGGIQKQDDPNPGLPYTGAIRRAYLPDNGEGREVLRLLLIAWSRKLLFKVGTSLTTGMENTVVWGPIEQKSRVTGGPTRYGYPDPTYLARVKYQLASYGVSLS